MDAKPDQNQPGTKSGSADAKRAVGFSATLGQLKTFANGRVTAVISADAGDLSKVLKLITACQAGNLLFLSAQIVKPKPVKKDAKKKPDPQKGPRRVRRYPYRD